MESKKTQAPLKGKIACTFCKTVIESPGHVMGFKPTNDAAVMFHNCQSCHDKIMSYMQYLYGSFKHEPLPTGNTPYDTLFLRELGIGWPKE